MNVYFACSITGGREFEGVYQQMVAALLAAGHEIPTSHLVESEVGERERLLTPQDVYERDTAWIRNCDALIAEVSVPSHGVGYEIGYALQMGKPVLCVYHRDRKVSKMITGNLHPALKVASYGEVGEATAEMTEFLNALYL